MMRLVLLLSILALPAAAEPGVLQVTVTGVRSAKGQIRVAVCDTATFLKPNCAHHAQAEAHPGAVTLRITGIPPGVYAIQAFQDENGNGKLDTNFLGMPREGMGFSRDAPMHYGPPSFADAAVTIPADGGAASFAIRYFD